MSKIVVEVKDLKIRFNLASEKVDNLIKLMDSGCTKVSGSGTGKGMISLTKALGVSDVTSKPKNPTFSIQAGTYEAETLSVKISAEKGMKIYYSLDGKNITYQNGTLSANAIEYKNEVAVTGSRNVTLKAIAINTSNGLASAVTSAKYVLKPVASEITIQSPTGINKVAVGKSLKLEAVVKPTYAKDTSVKWEVVDAPKGISVSKGVVSVKNTATTGTYKIKATAKNAKGAYEGVSATYSIIVEKAENPVSALTVKPAKVSVAAGKTASVTAAVKLKDGTVVEAGSYVTWTSSNDAIATVKADGNTVTITGVASGKATITGIANDGSGKKVTIAVTVTQPAKTLTISGPEKLAAGKSITLTAEVKPDKTTNKKVKWEMVTDTKSVSVNKSSGKVTAKASAAAGAYIVKATTTDGSDISATFTVTVTAEKMKTLKLGQKSVDLFRVKNSYGAPTSVSVPVTIAGGNADCLTVESSNKGVATASYAEGKLTIAATGKSTGTATITIKSTDGSNLKASCKVTVSNPATTLHLSPEKNRSYCLAKGKTMKLTPSFETAYGSINTSKIKKLEWKSSDASLATVDQNGKVKALKSSTDFGETTYVTITATAKDGSGVYASYDIFLCDNITSLCLWWDPKANYDEIYCNSAYYTAYPIAMYSGNYESICPSEELQVVVNKPGLSASFGYDTYYYTDGTYDVYYSLRLTGNERGTYKVTISCLDGSTAKKVYTIKVK